MEEYAKMGLVPEGTYRNKEFLREKIKLNDTIKESFEDLLLTRRLQGTFSQPEKERCQRSFEKTSGTGTDTLQQNCR